MNKRITSLLLSVVLVLLAVFLLRNEKVVDAADDLVLLEKRHPGYWEYLRPEKMIEVQTLPGFENTLATDIENENILTDFIEGQYAGVSVSNNNGTLTIKGTGTENSWPAITKGSINLSTGSYFITIGSPNSTASAFYLEGWKQGINHVLAYLDADHFFYIDASDYERFKLTMSISEGQTMDTSITPILYKISDENIFSDDNKLDVWKDVPSNISEEEWKIFNNSLLQQNHIYKVGAFFDDGSKKMLDSGLWIEAEQDELGRYSVDTSSKE